MLLLNIVSARSGRLVRNAVRHLVVIGVAVSAFNAVSPLEAAEADGKAPFERVCARCHGIDAQGAEGPGLTPMYLTRDNVVAIVRGGQAKMPALPKTQVTDEEITAIVAYLKSLAQ